jgi:hypothetical protein
MLRLVAAAVLASVLVGSVKGQTARVEIIPFASVTLKDSEFLSGDKGGQDITIAGELRLPKRDSDKLPAVVHLHGSGGLAGTGYIIRPMNGRRN